MRVAIVGGHGKIARHLTAQLVGRGDEAVSLIRDPAQTDAVDALGATPVVCDVEAAGVDALADAVTGADAVVFAAGAGPGSGAARKETVDYGGAVALVAAARAAGVDRYVMISSANADSERPGDEVFDVYLRAKGRADAELAASGLAHTIVRPVRLTDEPGTGRVQLADAVDRGDIPRADVAAVVAAVLAAPGTTGLTFVAAAGDTPVDEAVASLVR